jgi:hypothetical protein
MAICSSRIMRSAPATGTPFVEQLPDHLFGERIAPPDQDHDVAGA